MGGGLREAVRAAALQLPRLLDVALEPGRHQLVGLAGTQVRPHADHAELSVLGFALPLASGGSIL